MFEITGGQINDCTQVPALIAKVPAAQMIIADKGYDSEDIREQVEGANAVILRKRNSVKGNADPWSGLKRLIRTVLPEGRRWSQTLSVGDHAAHSSVAELVLDQRAARYRGASSATANAP